MLIRLYLTALIAFVLFLLAACRWQGAKEIPERMGNFTGEQFLDRAARLTEKLGPKAAAGMEWTLSAQSYCDRHGEIIDVCTVSGIDSASSSKFMVIFDVDTGALLRLTCAVRGRGDDEGQIRRPSEAVETAYYWLDILGAEAERSSRGVTDGVRKVGRTWYVQWRSGSSRAVVGIDAHTGNLKLLRRHHRRPASSSVSLTSSL